MSDLYDPAAQDCAEHFLSDMPNTGKTAPEFERALQELSVVIQQAVEAWFQDNEALLALLKARAR